MADLFERHDRSAFETFAVSLSPDEPSEMRQRLKRAFDHFVDVSPRGDRDVAGALREMEIDIAVDLMGHTRDAGRTSRVSCSADPSELSRLSGNRGADFMDYVIADKIVLPFEQQPHYAEKIVTCRTAIWQ